MIDSLHCTRCSAVLRAYPVPIVNAPDWATTKELVAVQCVMVVHGARPDYFCSVKCARAYFTMTKEPRDDVGPEDRAK